MDSTGQMGPQVQGFAKDVRELYAAMQDGGACHVALVDNGHRQDVIVGLRDTLRTADTRSPENMSEGVRGVPRFSNYVYVAVLGHGAYWFILSNFHAAEYLADKLGIGGGDAAVLAELLTRLHAEQVGIPA